MARILAIILAVALVPILALHARAANVTLDGYCNCKGIRLCGRVKVVERFADLRVEVVTSFPDLRVKRGSSFTDDIGEWQFVDYGEDFTVQFLDGFPDLTIQYVDAFPGVR